MITNEVCAGGAEGECICPPKTVVTCAFDRCQADGVILPEAPRHAFGYVVHDSSRPAVASYHPGCWAAQNMTTVAPLAGREVHTGTRGGPVG